MSVILNSLMMTASGAGSQCPDIEGTLWTWGHNVEGQLGLGDTTNRSAPVQVGSLTSWIAGAGMGAKGDAAFYLR